MGLDMFLYKTKRKDDVTPTQLFNIDSYFSYLDRTENCKDCTLEEWNGLDIDDIDMSLKEKYQSEYIMRYEDWDVEKKCGWKTIFKQVGYWRKANHIHGWFVENIQDAVDDCGVYEVSKEQLEDLLDICKKVLGSSILIVNNDGKYIEDTSMAERLLPTTSGFFFGSTGYDNWYLEDIKNTVRIIKEILKTTDFEKEIVIYHSSW